MEGAEASGPECPPHPFLPPGISTNQRHNHDNQLESKHEELGDHLSVASLEKQTPRQKS